MENNKEYCLCLVCQKQYTCDFSLSAWAAQARMKQSHIPSGYIPQLSFMTYKCDWFVRDENLLTPVEETAGGRFMVSLLNFKADVLTKNGNIYTKEAIENAFEEFNNRKDKFLIKLTQENLKERKFGTSLTDIVGRIEKLYIEPSNGNLVVNSFVSNKEILKLMRERKVSLSTDGYATYDKGKTINKFKIMNITVSEKGEFD